MLSSDYFLINVLQNLLIKYNIVNILFDTSLISKSEDLSFKFRKIDTTG